MQWTTEKYLLAMQCLNSAIALEPTNPKVHERTVQFRHVLTPELASLPSTTAEVLKAESPKLPNGGDLEEFNDEFLEKNKVSPAHVHAGIRARRMLGGDKGKCEEALVKLVKAEGLELREAWEVRKTLEGWGSGRVGEFKEGARGRWPEASGFA